MNSIIKKLNNDKPEIQPEQCNGTVLNDLFAQRKLYSQC